MKYSTISFERTSLKDIGWRVSLIEDPRDRDPCKEYKPHPGLNIFHYPKKWPASKAFKILKDAMIKRRKEEVVLWEREIKRIEDTELPEWIKDRENNDTNVS